MPFNLVLAQSTHQLPQATELPKGLSENSNCSVGKARLIEQDYSEI